MHVRYMVAAILLSLCLVGATRTHHKRGHDNFGFRDHICSADHYEMKPETCGELKELFETPAKLLPPIPIEALVDLLEIYEVCCAET